MARQTILRVCYFGYALCAIALFGLSLHGIASVWPIYAVLVLFGSARAFSAPAGQAIIPNLVPKKHLGSAVAWSSSGFQIATIAGPAVGGAAWRLRR